MERLINNSSPHATLQTQNRMRTEFVPLLSEFYDKLQSSPQVNKRLPPDCMKKSLYFWEHTNMETNANGVITNLHEAHMCVLLACWLVWNSEEKGKDVTILALYKGTYQFFPPLLPVLILIFRAS